MADISEVLICLRDIISPLIYPNGEDNSSIINKDVKIMPGFPTKNDFDSWLDAGNALINIYPTSVERNTTRYFKTAQTTEYGEPTLQLVIDGTVSVTFEGSVSTGENVIISANNVSYDYKTAEDDTLDSVALYFSQVIPNSNAVNNVLYLSDCYKLVANIGSNALMAKEVKRQLREIMIGIWTSGNTIDAISDRSTLGKVIDSYLSDMIRFVLPDNMWARIYYSHSKEEDMLETSNIYRRDLYYYVEYPTIVSVAADAILNAEARLKVK